VRRFVAQSLIAVAALLGPALAGLGSRAAAGYCWGSGVAREGTGALASEAEPERSPTAWPAPSQKPTPIALHLLPIQSGEMGGMGSSGSTQPTTNVFAGLASTDLPVGPTLVTRLCDRRRPPSLPELLFAIFEPPRA
jgi:hypothetical protein